MKQSIATKKSNNTTSKVDVKKATKKVVVPAGKPAPDKPLVSAEFATFPYRKESGIGKLFAALLNTKGGITDAAITKLAEDSDTGFDEAWAMRYMRRGHKRGYVWTYNRDEKTGKNSVTKLVNTKKATPDMHVV